MAECSGSQPTVDWLRLESILNITDHMEGHASDTERYSAPDSDVESDTETDIDHHRRSDMVLTIIYNRDVEHLGAILGGGWDMNETLLAHRFKRKGYYGQRTALGEAARKGWTEGVKMLLEAGAECMSPNEVENPLTSAIRKNPQCSPDLIELLLQHGVDPNYSAHNSKATPLVEAIKNCWRHNNLTIIKLLLDYGADPNAISDNSYYEDQFDDPLYETHFPQNDEVFASLLKMLVDFGADLNCRHIRAEPVLPSMMKWSVKRSIPCRLDQFFLHGGDINMHHGRYYGTALEYGVKRYGDCKGIRWLIKHGADISPINISMFEEHLIPTFTFYFYDNKVLILLEAGMRVSHNAFTQLRQAERTISAGMSDDKVNDAKLMFKHLQQTEEADLQRMNWNLGKSNNPEYLTQQMDDLLEFSDDSLNDYQDIVYRVERDCPKWKHILGQLQRVIGFLSKAQSLQWYCRCCVRENLVSLQPSVVKSLPIPVILKRFILCHEI